MIADFIAGVGHKVHFSNGKAIMFLPPPPLFSVGFVVAGAAGCRLALLTCLQQKHKGQILHISKMFQDFCQGKCSEQLLPFVA